ncbi:type II secretion system ATPase GspE [Pleionea sp. CnH1-48]|nr:type II secretion system ATPase GspE [Pleionea sp. CnH1-48]
MSAEPAGSMRLPFGFSRRHGVVVAEPDATPAEIVTKEGFDPEIIVEVCRHISKPITLKTVGDEEFERILGQTYQGDSAEAMQAMEDLGDEMDLFRLAEEIPETEDLLENEDDAPIIKLINALLTEAIKESASDIHIETFEKELKVRFRVDGVLREVLSPNRQLAPLLVSRIKVMAKLDIAEKRIPQDGRIALKIANRAVDVRVSTMPSSHGERIVLRLLDKQAGRLDFSHLGMPTQLMHQVSDILHKPHGIILVTGPTGSGKTTTLYAGLTMLNSRQRNILTVEDPVEYLLDGVGQTQVNSKVDMTFARGLRAMLRQDPDVVMVGEIRDLETAQIAVQASLTGHLVLSTLHTNTAVGAVTRLVDMGVEPFLLSSSILGVLAQRLVRTLCPDCKEEDKATAKECQLMGFDVAEAPVIYRAKGCEECRHLGYRGRQGLYELLLVDDEMRTMIHNGASEQEVEKYARRYSPSIREDGRNRVLEGTTTIEEVLRVTRED